jgi:site-specific recombinase XerD
VGVTAFILPKYVDRSVEAVLSDPRTAALANRMLSYYRDAREHAKTYKKETVDREMAVILDHLCFESVPDHRPKPPWEWDEVRYVAWCKAVHAGERRGLTSRSLRGYQGHLRLFLRLLEACEPLQLQCEDQFNRRVKNFIHEWLYIAHKTDCDETRKRPHLTREEIDMFFTPIRERFQEAWNMGRWKEAYALGRDYALFSTIYYLGLRAGEAIGLDRDSFSRWAAKPEYGDFGQCVAFGKAARGTGGVKQRREPVVTHDDLATVLKFFDKHIRPWYLKKVKTTDAMNAMFHSERGNRLSYAELLLRFNVHIVQALLQGRKHVPHSLRHSYVTHELDRHPSRVVQHQVGHKYEGTTVGYDHATKEHFKEKIRKVQKNILSGEGRVCRKKREE